MLCLCVTALAADSKSTEVKVIELKMKQVPEKPVFGQNDFGVTVVFSVSHDKKKISGADTAASEVSFTDDKGNDLFALGVKQRKTWDGSKRRFGTRRPENCISMLDRSIFDKNENKGEILIKCHALSLPSAGATSLLIKGKLVLLCAPKTFEKQIVSVKDLQVGKGIKLGKHDLKFGKGLSGLINGESFIGLTCDTDVVIKAVSIQGGKDSQRQLISFNESRSQHVQLPIIEIFKDNINPTQKIEIEYFVPEKEILDLNLKIGPNFSFISEKKATNTVTAEKPTKKAELSEEKRKKYLSLGRPVIFSVRYMDQINLIMKKNKDKKVQRGSLVHIGKLDRTGFAKSKKEDFTFDIDNPKLEGCVVELKFVKSNGKYSEITISEFIPEFMKNVSNDSFKFDAIIYPPIKDPEMKAGMLEYWSELKKKKDASKVKKTLSSKVKEKIKEGEGHRKSYIDQQKN